MIDPRTVASVCLVPYAYSAALGVATGFVVNHKNRNFLVTNYHVLSGKHPDTGELLPKAQASPDRVLIALLSRSGSEISWRPIVQQLRGEHSTLWVEHPTRGRAFDVVALPLAVPDSVQAVPYPFDPGPNLALHMNSEVAVIGYPEGMSGARFTAVWKGGTIASELELAAAEKGYFWIDSNTRPGMSGAPVVARRFGGALMNDGNYSVHTGVVDRVLGVYAGRAFDAPDMTLGRVWSWDGVQEVLDSAAELVHTGNLAPIRTSLGHIDGAGADMVSLDVKKSHTATIRLPNGTTETKTFTVGELLRELVLADKRFGVSLELIKAAAALEAAVLAAEKADGKLAVEPTTYSVVRECIDKPSEGFNPVVARHLLPLLDYIMDAGKAK